MTLKTIISFDLDGTLVDYSFVDAVWLEGMPRLYADDRGINLDSAKKRVEKKYNQVGMERLEWYNIQFWLNRFELPSNKQEILFNKYKDKITVYPEVYAVLNTLQKEEHPLVVTSNAARSFLDIELEETNLKKYFYQTFSATSDFKQVKKTKNLYQKILEKLNISSSEVIHVGDNWHFDYIAPKKAGIKSYFLDRKKQRSGEEVVNDLTEFLTEIL